MIKLFSCIQECNELGVSGDMVLWLHGKSGSFNNKSVGDFQDYTCLLEDISLLRHGDLLKKIEKWYQDWWLLKCTYKRFHVNNFRSGIQELKNWMKILILCWSEVHDTNIFNDMKFGNNLERSYSNIQNFVKYLAFRYCIHIKSSLSDTHID